MEKIVRSVLVRSVAELTVTSVKADIANAEAIYPYDPELSLAMEDILIEKFIGGLSLNWYKRDDAVDIAKLLRKLHKNNQLKLTSKTNR